MHFAVAESERNPTLEFESAKEACECEARGDWIGAEAAYRKRQALQEATVNFGLIWKAHRDLSQLFLLIGDLDQADQVGKMATEAARRTDLFPLKVMALEDHARHALRRGDHAGALKAASEAVDHVEAGSVYDQMRAGALALRARCRIAAGDVEGAEQDLAASKPILLDRETSPIFAGAHGKASVWWEAAAAICTQRGDRAGAAEAWANAVDRRRHISSLQQVAGPYTLAALSRALRHWSEALTAAGQLAEARKVLAESQNLWGELGLPEQADG